MRAAIYTRISRDSGNSKAGVKRQRDDCDAFCLSEGFTVVDYFVDNDESAYNGKTRPDIPHQEMWYQPVFPNASGRLGITPDGEVTEGRFGYAHSVSYQIASVVAERTALEVTLATYQYSQEDFSMTVTKAALYCTPY